MPNYEELYYIARNKYNQAIEDKNEIRRRSSELQGEKSSLTRQLNEKQSALVEIQKKKLLVQETLKKCQAVIDNEYVSMKTDLQSTSDEYKKIISTDTGVADLFSIYSSDIASTQSNLNSILEDFKRILNDYEEQERAAQSAVTTCSNELASVSNQLNHVGNEAEAQRRINNYYTEMKEYEARWQNGEE